MRLGVVGASGFIGSNVMGAGAALDLEIQAVRGVRITNADGVIHNSRDWVRSNSSQLNAMCDAVAGLDVVVNAAGFAGPASNDAAGLAASNVGLPAILARACAMAGVRRLVHVSSAAVQGRRDPLDESYACAPFSPYSRSKAEAEQCLRDAIADDVPPELVIYRPTSVHGAGRSITRQLTRLAAAPVVPLSGAGDQPLPLALVANVAAGILFAATWTELMPVVLQPSEGMTTRHLFELLGSKRFVSLPRSPVGWVLGAAGRYGGRRPPVASLVRSLELFCIGQRVSESSLTRAGFKLPVGLDGWERLAGVS